MWCKSITCSIKVLLSHFCRVLRYYAIKRQRIFARSRSCDLDKSLLDLVHRHSTGIYEPAYTWVRSVVKKERIINRTSETQRVYHPMCTLRQQLTCVLIRNAWCIYWGFTWWSRIYPGAKPLRESNRAKSRSCSITLVHTSTCQVSVATEEEAERV